VKAKKKNRKSTISRGIDVDDGCNDDDDDGCAEAVATTATTTIMVLQ
jgi:hypothetical protein